MTRILSQEAGVVDNLPALRPQNVPASVIAAQQACAGLDDTQRVALANELIRYVQNEGCVLSLKGLATVASETARELMRRGQARRAG